MVIFLSAQMILVGPTNSSALFVRTWGWRSGATGTGVVLDPAGNIYVTGEADSATPSSKVVLLKYNQTGGLVWQKVWGGESGYQAGYGVTVDALGNIYVTGIATDFNPYGLDQAFLLKYDSAGNLVWQKAWGNFTETNGNGTYGFEAYGISIGPSDEIYVTGSVKFLNNTNALVLFRFDQKGNTVWQQEWTGNYGQRGFRVAADGSGGIYVTGYTSSYDVQAPNGNTPQTFCSSDPCGDGVLLKFNSTGNLQWQTIWRQRGVYGNLGSSIALEPSGDILVGGYAGTQVNLTFAYTYATVSKFTGGGSILWHRTWRDNVTGPSNDPTSQNSRPEYNTRTQAIGVDDRGNVFAIGSDSGNLFIMRLDSRGTVRSQSVLTGLLTSGDAGEVATDSSGIPVAVGSIHDDLTSFNTTVLHQSLDDQLPITPVPRGIVQNLNTTTFDLNGKATDVEGSDTYSGGSNVWLNYGLSFAFSKSAPPTNTLVNPLAIALLTLIPVTLIAIFLLRGEKRKTRDARQKST